MKISLKHFFLGMLIGTIPTCIIVLILAASGKPQAEVLGSGTNPNLIIITPDPTPTPTPTPSPSPTPSPTPKPTPKPTPTPVPTPSPSPTPTPKSYTRAEIEALIDRFAGQYGTDAGLLKFIAQCESEFNPLAVNGAYAGLFQFGPVTWGSNRKAMGEDPNTNLRLDAEESAQTAAYVLSTRGGGVWPNCLK